jgi:D-lyxose ketol-isomerase
MQEGNSMKRSQLNLILKDTITWLDSMNYKLPPFAFLRPEEWKGKGHDYDEIRDNMLGWDITDFGRGEYEKTGLLLFTIRNGNLKDPTYTKPYAEKLLISQEDQVCPMHFHWNKMEDIINRGGGNLMIQLWNSTDEDGLADTPVKTFIDGHISYVEAGTIVRLTPGESITLPPRQYHAFWAEKGHGPCLIGEVSMVNDDNTDNRFYEKQGRFPSIEEDEAPLHLLCNEYPPAGD